MSSSSPASPPSKPAAIRHLEQARRNYIGGDFEHLFKESMAARYYLDQPRRTLERIRICEAKLDRIAAYLKALGYDLKAP